MEPFIAVNSLQILSKPLLVYTEAIGQHHTSETIKLRIAFQASGTIGGIVSVSQLPDGLTERAIEAAKAIKFKPAAEKWNAGNSNQTD